MMFRSGLFYGAHGGIADGFDIYDATQAKHRLFINTSGSVGAGNHRTDRALAFEKQEPLRF